MAAIILPLLLHGNAFHHILLMHCFKFILLTAFGRPRAVIAVSSQSSHYYMQMFTMILHTICRLFYSDTYKLFQYKAMILRARNASE